jgi:hypothetical protein
MKTIAFNGKRNMAGAFLVLAALGGLYYFRRQGKSVSDLLTAGTDSLKQARNYINRVAPSVAPSINQTAQKMGRAKSVSASAQI